MSYQYIGNKGDFRIENPEDTSYLYFPLANENGVMGCIAPDLGGDSKMGQNTFFMPPVSVENLHNDKSSRNFWCQIDGEELWSLTGRSGKQQAERFTKEKEETLLEAGMMHHKTVRRSKKYGLEAEIQSFVPSSGEQMELMRVIIRNKGDKKRRLKVTAAIPIYGRSADNIRDHRHVTALLHRIETRTAGVIVNPTMTFDERGHQRNEQIYGVFGGNKKERPIAFFPTVESFIGEGGNLENPRALYEQKKGVGVGYRKDGYEALGGLAFQEHELLQGEELTYIFVMAYGKDVKEMEALSEAFLEDDQFEKSLNETIEYWQKKVNIFYHTSDTQFDQWMRWVSFQPMLRRIYGCSFLPHHDYGKGGRGWRDLWQDCLALLLMNPDGVRQMLIDNFAGVRADGTNATIIGSGQGEFIADRNNITRVWMDHGVWPFLTTELYIQQTGDWKVLLEENTYFKDMQVFRGEQKDMSWREEEGEKQRSQSGEIYKGSILEHLLIQHLTSFYDVGEHNHIRIRGADWNDALDLASKRGESVAFTAMYGENMRQISALLSELEDAGIKELPLMKELSILLNKESAVYDDIKKKREILEEYCDSCKHLLNGEKPAVQIKDLKEDLQKKAAWICEHIRETEWIQMGEDCGWYNGYYDNSGNRVEGEQNGQIRMMLTGQVFALMSKTATKSQIQPIVHSADKYLFDANVGGYKLNTDFKEIKMDLGRMFGFAYGHKENGAVFSHMTTMFGNALYQRHASIEAYKVIQTLFQHCSDFEKSRIYPGIPEYIEAEGRGVYHYLTGAASWMLLTVVTQMFGVRGKMGDLIFDPQLQGSQFSDHGEASIKMIFAERQIHVIYENKKKLNPNQYQIREICINGERQKKEGDMFVVKREVLSKLPKEETIEIRVVLGEEEN